MTTELKLKEMTIYLFQTSRCFLPKANEHGHWPSGMTTPLSWALVMFWSLSLPSMTLLDMSEEQYTYKTRKVVKMCMYPATGRRAIDTYNCSQYIIYSRSSQFDTQIDCLEDFSHPLVSSNRVVVQDILRFLKGDTSAQSFERGTQSGGTINVEGADATLA